MKKFTRVIAALMAVSMMYGCGSAPAASATPASSAPASAAPASATPAPASATPAPTTAAAAKVDVTIMQFKVEIQDALVAATQTYMKENPNVNIILTTVGGGSDYGAALKTKMASGAEPTIFNIDGSQAMQDWSTKLTDLSDTKSASTAIKSLMSPVTKDGKVYGVPYDLEGYGLIYNKAVFAKAGIDATKILTFADLEKATKTLDSKKKELGLTAVFALPVKETWVTGLHMADVYLAGDYPSVADTFNAKTIPFKYGKEFQQMFDLQNKYSVQPTISMDYSTQVEKNFSLGKVAMIQQGNWVYPTVAGIDADFAKTNIGMFPDPSTANAGKIPVGTANFWAVNSDAKPEQVAAAKAFLDWLNTSDEGKTVVLTKFNFVPAYTGYDNSKIADPLSQAVAAYAAAGNTYAWTFPSFPSNWGMGTLGAELQSYAGGKETWADVVKKSQDAWATARK